MVTMTDEKVTRELVRWPDGRGEWWLVENRGSAEHPLYSPIEQYDVSHITDRPWSGRDATTGLTMADFAERIDGLDVPAWVTRAAVSIVRAYGIKGWADVGYIANVINGRRES